MSERTKIPCKSIYLIPARDANTYEDVFVCAKTQSIARKKAFRELNPASFRMDKIRKAQPYEVDDRVIIR